MIRTILTRLLGDERGVTLVEYGIGLTLAVIVGTTALTVLGQAVDDEMGAACTTMSGGSVSTGAAC